MHAYKVYFYLFIHSRANDIQEQTSKSFDSMKDASVSKHEYKYKERWFESEFFSEAQIKYFDMYIFIYHKFYSKDRFIIKEFITKNVGAIP